MRITSVFNRLLSLQGLWIQGVIFEGSRLVMQIRRRFRLLTCPVCGTTTAGRESTRRRRWRHLALWGAPVFLEGEVRRLWCRTCNRVVTEEVPWARHNSVFTRQFEDVVALLAQQTNKTAVARLTGISWVTVGAIVDRVVAEGMDADRLKSLRRIAVDEISFRKRHKYLTVVSDHDTRGVVWVAEGKSSDVLGRFFQELSPEVCAIIEIVTMDMSGAYQKAVREALPNAKIAFDHFHIAKLANEALDTVRRDLARAADTPEERKGVKDTRWPLLHREDNLPEKHKDIIATLNPRTPLGRAYLLKECLLDILRGCSALPLEHWISWASRSRLRSFVRLAKTLREHIAGVAAFMLERFTNGLAEGLNNKIRIISHRAFGFHSATALIAMIYLCCGGITVDCLQLV